MAVIAFTGFLGIVLASTVFTREVEVRQYKLIPFWSWREVVIHHDMELLQEILLNCILLEFQEDYPDVLNGDNLVDILKAAKAKKEKNKRQ